MVLPNPVTLGNNANVIIGNTVNAPLSFAAAVTLQGSNQFTINSTGGTTFSAGFTQLPVTATSPAAALTLAGAAAATVDLPVASTYTGGTTISGPVVMLGANNPLGTGVINMTSGTFIAGAPATIGSPQAAGGTTLSNNVLLGGNFSFNGAAPLTFNGTATLTAGITLTANGTTTFANGIGEFGPSRALTVAGNGLLALAGQNNTYSGGTTLNGGTFGNAVTLAISGATTASNGVLVSGPLGIGTVTWTSGVVLAPAPLTLGNQVTLNSSTGGSPVVFNGSPITITGTTTTTVVDLLNVNNTTTFAGPITGTGGAFTIGGTGNLVLTAANTITGITTVNSGTLTLSGNGTAPNVTGFVVNQGGTLTLDNTGINLPDSSTGVPAGRIGNGTSLTMNGGTFNFLGNATTGSSENIGALILGAGSGATGSSGNSTISSTNGAAGSALFFSSLTRAANGGTVNFVTPAGAAPLGGLTGNSITIGLNAATGLITGENHKINSGVSNILPFATVTSPSGQQDFATDLGGGVIGAFSAYTVGLSPFLTGTEVVELAGKRHHVGHRAGASGRGAGAGLGNAHDARSGRHAVDLDRGHPDDGRDRGHDHGWRDHPGDAGGPDQRADLDDEHGSSLTLDSPINLTPGSTATATA